MIFGSCPHCDAATINYLAPDHLLPCFSKEKCEGCEKEYWLKHSRIDPVAYAEKPDNVNFTPIVHNGGT